MIKLARKTLLSHVIENLSLDLENYFIKDSQQPEAINPLEPFRYIGSASGLPPNIEVPYVMILTSKGPYGIYDIIYDLTKIHVIFIIYAKNPKQLSQYFLSLVSELIRNKTKGCKLFPVHTYKYYKFNLIYQNSQKNTVMRNKHIE